MEMLIGTCLVVIVLTLWRIDGRLKRIEEGRDGNQG